MGSTKYVYTQHPAQKFNPHSRNAKSIRTAEATIANVVNENKVKIRMTTEKIKPILAANIFGALSIVIEPIASTFTTCLEIQLNGLLFILVNARM